MGEVYLFRNEPIVLSPMSPMYNDYDECPNKRVQVKFKGFRPTMEKGVEKVQQSGSLSDDSLYLKQVEILESQGAATIKDEVIWIYFKPLGKNLLEVKIFGLQRIHDIFSGMGKGYTLSLELTEVKCHDTLDPRDCGSTGGEMWTAYRQTPSSSEPIRFHYRNVFTFPLVWCWHWNSRCEQKAIINLKLCSDITDVSIPKLLTKKLLPSDPGPLSFTKKLLEDGIATDMVIVSESGSTHPCHKLFLIGHSPVFEAMFQREWKESSDNTVKMNDISKEGVEAVLAYIYCRDLEKPLRDLKVALEVLMFANKYGIPTLETTMVTLILGQPVQWFPTDAVLQLYVTLKGCEIPSREELESKAVAMMKTRLSDLISSPDYKYLSRNNPRIFFELSTTLVHHKRK